VIALNRTLLVAAVSALVVAAAPHGAAWATGADARVRGAREHYEQAVAHYNLDEFAPALAEFREAYRLKPDPSFLFNIAQCHRKLGETDAALDFYRKYLRNLPNAPNRADVERMIADLRAQRAESAPAPAPPAPPAPPDTTPSAPEPATPVVPLATPTASQAALEPGPPPAGRAEALVATTAGGPAREPLYRRWWFWTALGVVVAGAVVAAIAVSRPAPQPYQGTLDPHTLGVP
jgi:tetratricopeptide (TPR) repeat protein